MALAPATIKVGGEVLADPAAIALLAAAVVETAAVVVHGAGPQVTALCKRLGIEPRQIAGRRITDPATLDVVKLALGGAANVDLCAGLSRGGAHPVGLSGVSVVRAVRRPPRVVSGAGPDPIDFGEVGDVVAIDTTPLARLVEAGYVPVVSSLGADAEGRVFNINADVVAARVAAALHSPRLVQITAVPGVLRDPADPGSVIARLTAEQARAAISAGTITGGMIPKIDEGLAAIALGVPSVVIVDAAGARAALRGEPAGTVLTAP